MCVPETLHREVNLILPLTYLVYQCPKEGTLLWLREVTCPQGCRQYVTEAEIRTKSAQPPLHELPTFHTASVIQTPQAPKLTSKSPLGI